ncbi:unnamed protein product, partial [Owenia fusiformis]
EMSALKDRSTVKFSCLLIHQLVPGYCFSYISVASSKAINRLATICRPTTANSVIHGGFGSWSAWGTCSTSCGEGRQSRYRLCDSPKPSIGGRFCEGPLTESMECNNTPCDGTGSNSPNYNQIQKCPCGCDINAYKGKITTHGKCHGISVWKIALQQNYHIDLRFTRFNLRKGQWVKVRAGGQRSSDLLMYGNAGDLNEVDTREILRSKSNVIRIEFQADSTEVDPDWRSKKKYGFDAVYESKHVNVTVNVEVTQTKQVDKKHWSSALIIAGTTITVILVLLFILGVVYKTSCKKYKDKYKLYMASKLGEQDPEKRNQKRGSRSSQGSKKSNIYDFPPSHGTLGVLHHEYHDISAHSTPARNSHDITCLPEHVYEEVPILNAAAKSPVEEQVKCVGSQDDTPKQKHEQPHKKHRDKRKHKHGHKSKHKVEINNEKSNMTEGINPDLEERQRPVGASMKRGENLESLDNIPEDLKNNNDDTPTQTNETKSNKNKTKGTTKETTTNKLDNETENNGNNDIETDTMNGNTNKQTTKQVKKDPQRWKRPHSGTPLSPSNLPPPVGKESSPTATKPGIKILPLRDISRPDGQSPRSSLVETGAPSTAESSPLEGIDMKLIDSCIPDLTTPSDHMSIEEMEFDDTVYYAPGSYFDTKTSYQLTYDQIPSAAPSMESMEMTSQM